MGDVIDPQNKRPGIGYFILVVLAILVAIFIVLPVGLQVRGVFQKLDTALQRK